MDIGTIARVSIIPLFAIILFYHAHRLYQSRARQLPFAAGLLTFVVLLILVAVGAALIEPPTVVSVLVTAAATHQATLLVYFAIEQINRNDPPHGLFLRRRRYIVGTLLSGGVLVLEWLRRDNLGSFIDNEPFRPTLTYYTAYAWNYAVLFFFNLQVVHLTWRNARKQHAALTYKARHYLSACAFGWACLSCIIVEVNILLTVAFGDMYRDELNALYHAIKPIVCVLLLVASSPTRILQLPAQLYLHKRKERQDRWLAYLHARLMRIVPAVHLEVEGLGATGLEIENDDQVIHEISDARELIYSHFVGQEILKPPAEEAKLLYDLLQKRTRIEAAGVYDKPVEQKDPLNHSVAVAKHLQRLEHS